MGGQTPDRAIYQNARECGFVIGTADPDFVHLADALGAPPKSVRLERMDYSTEVAADLIRRDAIALSDFEESARAVLILRR